MALGAVPRAGGWRQIMVAAIASALLLALAVSAVWIAEQSQEDADWVTHSLEVRNALSDLRTLVRRAESGQRGYLLTGEEDYLETYSSAAVRMPSVLVTLGDLVADNQQQSNALATLTPRLRKKVSEMDETIQLYKAGNRDGALALVRSGAGWSLMEQVGAIVGRMERVEARLLAERVKDRAWSRDLLVGVAVVVACLLLALGALAMVMTRRVALAQLAARRVLETANERLETVVAERTADLREANAEVQRFAYIVSHDLRSPLVNVMGFTSELEMLRTDLRDLLEKRRPRDQEAAPDKEMDAIDRDMVEALGFIKTSTTKMDKLINAILTLSRQGRRDFRPERVAMRQMIEAIGGSVAHQLHAADATLTVGPLPDVVSDRMAIEQIFGNLVDNAVKYLRNGVPGRIDVTAEDMGPLVVYRVRDNGRGIDEKDRDRVFELFRRSGVQDRPGEGIGLAHVRALVRRLGGTITFASVLGQGTTFMVTLPREVRADTLREAA